MFDIDKPLVVHIYNAKLQGIYSRYSTKDLVKLSRYRYKIGT